MHSSFIPWIVDLVGSTGGHISVDTSPAARFAPVTSTCLHHGPSRVNCRVTDVRSTQTCGSWWPRPGQYAGMNNLARPSLYILLTFMMQSSAQVCLVKPPVCRWYFWSFTLLLSSDTNVSALIFITPCSQISKPFIPLINDHEFSGLFHSTTYQCNSRSSSWAMWFADIISSSWAPKMYYLYINTDGYLYGHSSAVINRLLHSNL